MAITKHERSAINDYKITIWIDADACPKDVKNLLLKTSSRLSICLVFVANQSIPVPDSPLVNLLVVPDGPDVADKVITAKVCENDVVVTQDIPLAASVVEKKAIAIGPRGELFDDKSVHSRLASRDLMEQLRSAGMETRGPKPFSKKDIQSFANTLDKTLTRCLRKIARQNQ